MTIEAWPSKQVFFLIILGHSLIYFNFCFVEVQAAAAELDSAAAVPAAKTWPDCHDSSPRAGPGPVRGEGR